MNYITAKLGNCRVEVYLASSYASFIEGVWSCVNTLFRWLRPFVKLIQMT